MITKEQLDELISDNISLNNKINLGFTTEYGVEYISIIQVGNKNSFFIIFLDGEDSIENSSDVSFNNITIKEEILRLDKCYSLTLDVLIFVP